MLTALLFIIVISILVFVHEFGHFWVAKKTGMRVDEFGFGFPPRVWGIKKGETTYSINWIPFGGFVKIYGEDGDDRDSARSFGSKSFSARMAVILAGVAMNVLFAGVLLVAGNFFGLRIGLFTEQEIQVARDRQVQVIAIAPDSPAANAGIQLLDSVKGFTAPGEDFTVVESPKQVQEFVAGHLGETILVSISRGNETTEKEVELRTNPPAGQGSLGISMALTGVINYPWYVAIWKGFYDAAILTYNTAYGFYILISGLFTDHSLAGEVSGPIGIATLTGQAARVGLSYLIQFIAMISVNLAVLNVIPFPALDGGRAFLLIVEKIKGSPLRRKTEAVINATGFLLLISLMLIITARDISRLF